MKISVSVKIGASENYIKKKGDVYEIKLKSRPHKGKANKELVSLLGKYFKIPKSQIVIKSGISSRNKIIEILN